MWYFGDLTRSSTEAAALKRLATSVDWLTLVGERIDEHGRLIWDIDIDVPGGVRSMSLRYPAHFPHSPPSVFPRGDNRRWTQHQYGPGGELCLEHGPDNWHPDLTGADMIESAHRLLSAEAPITGEVTEVASRHKTTLGQNLRATFMRLVLTRASTDALARIPEGVFLVAKGIGMYHGESYVHVIASITFPDGQT
jgi:hypothetical protein